MSHPLPKACPEWAEALAAIHPDDLSPARRAALNAHLATCHTCSAVRADYERLERAIQQVPTSRPLPAFPTRLLVAGNTPPTRHPAPNGSLSPDTLRLIPQKGTFMTPQRRVRGVAAALAIAAVVALFAFLFRGFTLSHTASGPQDTPTPRGAVTPTAQANTSSTPLPSQWAAATTTLENQQALPMIAPSNANIIYEAAAGSGKVAVLRRSDDGGKTWHNLSLPGGKLPSIDVASIAVSPLNPVVVVLSLSTYSGNYPNCTSALAQGGSNPLIALSGSTPCTQQYLSTNSGKNWSLMHLPGNGFLGAPELNQVVLPNSSDIFRAQGQRLYAMLGIAIINGNAVYTSGARIVSSNDGGKTWQYADAALEASGQYICDYRPTATGSTLFAIAQNGSFCYDFPTSTSYLWRSDDAGATWTQVSQFPALASNLAVVSRGASAPLLYALPATPYNDGAGAGKGLSLFVSNDGGKTWNNAPTKGIPGDATQEQGPLATLSDGSVIVEWQLPGETDTLLSLSPGASTWRSVVDHIAIGAGNVLVTTSQGADTLWVIGQSEYQGPYTVSKFGKQNA
jgi:photosystem II stability/assembly factor-like uncharacterized protein